MSEIENVYIRTLLKSIKMFRILFSLLIVSFSFAQQTNKVDFIKCDALVAPNHIEKSISGKVIYEFKIINYLPLNCGALRSSIAITPSCASSDFNNGVNRLCKFAKAASGFCRNA